MRKRTMSMLAGLCLMASLVYAQRVRVAHASPDAPPVDIHVDGQLALSGIPFGEYTDYVDLGSGQHNFGVFVSGTDVKVLETNAFLSPGFDYSVFAIGFATPGASQSLRLLLVQDQNAEPAEGFAKVRVIHGAPSAPDVDVYWTKPYVAIRNVTPVLTSLPFGGASGYLVVPAGKAALYQGRVAVAGTKTVAIDSHRLILGSGEVRTVIALDNAGGGTPFSLVVLRDRN